MYRTFPYRTFPEKGVSPHGQITWEAADDFELEPYYPLLKSELLKYPKDIIHKSKIEKIILCKQLKLNGKEASGIAGFDHGTIYFDVMCGSYDSGYQRRTIHHEVFNMIDYRITKICK